LCLSLIVQTPALARDSAPPYEPLSGAFSEGYKEKLQSDGSYRIVTRYNARDPIDALDVALYRAADLAQKVGMPYVQILSGSARSDYGVSTGYVSARPADSAAAPTTCRDKHCYTADVAKVLYILSGPSGTQPGVAKQSSVDERGRAVTVMGLGIGAIAWADR